MLSSSERRVVDHGFFIAIALLLTTHLNCFSQNERNVDELAPKSFISWVEVFAGPNVSFPKGPSFFNEVRAPKYGYAIGATVFHAFSKRTSIGASFIWESKGTKSSLEVLWQSVSPPEIRRTENIFTLRYLTLAIVPAIAFGNKERISLEMGGYASYLENVEFEQTTYRSGNPDTYTYSTSKVDRKDYDFGIVASIKYSIPVRRNLGLNLKLMDAFGLTDITNPNMSFLPVENHTLSILIGLNLQ